MGPKQFWAEMEAVCHTGKREGPREQKPLRCCGLVAPTGAGGGHLGGTQGLLGCCKEGQKLSPPSLAAECAQPQPVPKEGSVWVPPDLFRC